MELLEGVGGVGVAAPVDLDAAGLEAGVAATAASTMASRSSAGVSGRPLFCHGWLATTSSTRSRREGVAGVDGRDQMPDVDGVEGAPQDPERSVIENRSYGAGDPPNL